MQSDAKRSAVGGAVLCPWARQIILCLVLVQPRKIGYRSALTKIVDWDIMHPYKTNKVTLHLLDKLFIRYQRSLSLTI